MEISVTPKVIKEKRFVEHDNHIDIEANFHGIWAVIRCGNGPSFEEQIEARLEKDASLASTKQRKSWSERHPGRIASTGSEGRFSKYGITKAIYTSMVDSQGGKCAICGRIAALVVDHSHETGKVRGLLCSNCNSGLGFMGDNPVVLRTAADYLARQD